jgi:RNA polymerase sigma factor (sigma-70 family)
MAGRRPAIPSQHQPDASNVTFSFDFTTTLLENPISAGVMEKLTDSELVALVRSGQKNAFGPLIERYQTMVRQIITGMVANHEVARELAQEAILQAYLSLDHLRDSVRFKSWLYGITLNVCRSYIREQKMETLSLEMLMGGMHGTLADLARLFDDVDPEAIAEQRELHRIVLQAVQGLSPRDRAATLMFYYEQLSLEEIATILEISVGAVKGRLHRARKQLRAQLLSLDQDIQQPARARKSGRKVMIKVTINSVRQNTATKQHVVTLQDEAGQRALFIWIAAPEALVIAAGLNKVSMPRPMTAHLTANLLKATSVELVEVRIEALKEEVFYAVVKVRNGDVVQEIDARPSDALSLAVQLGSPIYVAEEVMQQCGLMVPEGHVLRPFNEEEKEVGYEAVTAKVAEMTAFTHPKAPKTPEERQEDYRKFVEFMTEEVKA